MTRRLPFLSLLAGLLLCFSASVYGADTQTIRLTVPKGSSVTLTFGGRGQVSVDWGNGAQSYSVGTVTGTAEAETIEVNLAARITTFDCSGQGVTALDVSKATELMVLNCADNALTELSVGKMKALQELNCSNNKLTELSVASNTLLRYLDCSDNLLSTLALTRNTELQVLGCSRNKIPSLTLSPLKDLRALWADDNLLIGTLSVAQEGMSSIVLSNNDMERLNLNPTKELKDLWVDNNQLITLNLGTATGMKTINLSNNALRSLTLGSVAGMDVYLADFSRNKLGLQYFYAADKVKNYNCGLQSPVDFGIDTIVVNTMADFSPFMANSGGSKVGSLELYNAKTGQPLVKGNSEEGDYQALSGRVRFWHAIDSVYAVVTAAKYPTLEIHSNTFTVYDPDATGISTLSTDGLAIAAGEGYLSLRSSQPTDVRIVATDGRVVWTGTVGQTTVNLPAGIYLVNNRKVQVK